MQNSHCVNTIYTKFLNVHVIYLKPDVWTHLRRAFHALHGKSRIVQIQGCETGSQNM